MKSQELDKTDKIILSELQKNAQRPIAEDGHRDLLTGDVALDERFH